MFKRYCSIPLRLVRPLRLVPLVRRVRSLRLLGYLRSIGHLSVDFLFRRWQQMRTHLPRAGKRVGGSLCLSLLLLGWVAPAVGGQSDRQLLLPIVFRQNMTPQVLLPPDQNPNHHEQDEESHSEEMTYCSKSNTRERELARMMRQHPQQRRAEMVCDPILAQIARAKAEDMARRGYVAHETPEGIGPNQLVRNAGYVLPLSYNQAATGNNIESLAAGAAAASVTWEIWMELTPHRTHLLAETPFFVPQTHYGIGHVFVPGSVYGHYWVVLTAPPIPGSSATEDSVDNFSDE